WFLHGLARLVVIPVGLFLIVYAYRSRPRALLSWLPAAAGGLAISAPMFFSIANWKVLLWATPVHSEIAGDVASDVAWQMVGNGMRGLLAFLTGARATHFTAGPHVEPVTALLVLAGVGLALANLGRCWRSRAWLLGGGLFILAVSAIQQTPFISNTRMFVLLPVYAVFAGLGGAALITLLFRQQGLLRWAACAAVFIAGTGLNLLHIERISLPNNAWPPEALLMQQMQASAAPDGGGMPVFIVAQTVWGARENQIARAYETGRERLVLLEADEALQIPQLCVAGGQAAMALIPAGEPQIDGLRERIATCWPGHEETTIPDHRGQPTLYRFLTSRGLLELERSPDQRHSDRQDPDTLAVPEPGDIVVDTEGMIYVLSLGEPRIYRFAADGRPSGRVQLVQDHPSAMALTPDGLLLVASTGDGSRLVWYDGDGTVVRSTSPDLPLGTPRGVAVAASGEIFVADDDGARVVRMSPGGGINGQLTAGGRIERPASVALGSDDTLWVLNARGELLRISLDDRVLASVPVPPAAAEHGWRLLQAAGGDLIMAEPDARRVVHRNQQGSLLGVWNGFEYPVALAIDAAGRLFISDWTFGQVAILPPVAEGVELVAAALRRGLLPEPPIPTAVPASESLPVRLERLPFEPDFVYQGNEESHVWEAEVGEVTVSGGTFTVRVAAIPGRPAVYDYLRFLGSEGQECLFEAEDIALTTGDGFSLHAGRDGHWWLQDYVGFSGGAGLVAELGEEVPVLVTTVLLPDGSYRMTYGTFTGDRATGPFGSALEY
ncbi:MAG TPA: NHL repeat-containing protein, partial [Anaerolineae bacterium]|nr:NHL repeat-containing protein [Anaerolineae bacterium]